MLNCHSTKDYVSHYIGIEDKKVSLLKELVDETKAKIVLVSSWKEWWFKDDQFKIHQDDLANYLDEKLAKQGLTIFNKTRPINRGRSILKFIEDLEDDGVSVNNFVILDDEMFDYKETKLTKNLVQTSFDQNGLERKHIRKALGMLC